MAWHWKLLIEKCTGCGICFDVCQEDAIHMSREMAYPEPIGGNCIGCMECVEECGFEAIEVNELIQEEVL